MAITDITYEQLKQAIGDAEKAISQLSSLVRELRLAQQAQLFIRRSLDMASIEKIELADLKLNSRAVNALKYDGCTTVGDLLKKDAHEILRTPNMGRSSLHEITVALAQYGPSLRPSDPRQRPI